MASTRSNVWDLETWAEPILWFARGVKAMKDKPLADRTSWWFYAAMHGADIERWERNGYMRRGMAMPVAADVARYWDQCQHQTWYFLPWHRGYLHGLEAVLRAEIVRLQGPETWALPYWNYFKDGQNELPPAFRTRDWPDGRGNNPLFVAERYGPRGDGQVVIPLELLNLNALAEARFTGVGQGGSPGFGGPDTGFTHFGDTGGLLESMPHNLVHVLVGGARNRDGRFPGLMSDPDTAALDPIFWLHHANVDRLWQVWRQGPPRHADPASRKWLRGPGSIGERIFSVPNPDGTPRDFTPADVASLSKLGYTYDDLTAPAPPGAPAGRLARLRARAAVTPEPVEGAPMPDNSKVEKLGANDEALQIVGDGAATTVRLAPGARARVRASLDAAANTRSAAPAGPPDRVFLNLENVRGLADGTVLQVYVGSRNAPDAEPQLAGTVGLFGLRKATAAPAAEHASGVRYVLEITDIIDALHLDAAFEADALDVRIVPLQPVAAEEELRIGGVSVFRQSDEDRP